MIQVETLGAGGGSIGWIDEMGLMQMGPQSAGSDPGPACYGQGGKLPTVSDSNLVMGYLNPDGLVGGRLPLDYQKAYDAIKTNLADPLGLSVERAAYGMFTIVNANMVNGIRRVTVERGYDPRDFVLVGAGGATAAHITALADAMGIDTIVLPKLASGLCAFGQIISDVKYNYMATAPLRLDNRRGLCPHRRAVQPDRGAGHRASENRRLQGQGHRRQAQPGHAVCRASA
jgi:N-methylhydantoinase A